MMKQTFKSAEINVEIVSVAIFTFVAFGMARS